MEFSDKIKEFLKEEFNDVDIYSLSKDELLKLREEIVEKRQEYFQLEMAFKTLGNAAYGASANQYFYFFNVSLAGDITAECRKLTKTMNANLIEWFHEGIWERKDLWEQFDFALDESKHDWYREQKVWIYSDTDSLAEDSVLIVKRNGQILKKTFKELFHENYMKHGAFTYDDSGKELCMSNDEVLNWTKEKGLHFVPIKYIMKHKVSKARFKIKTKSGKEVIVTGDHSCIVFRNGEQLTVKASEINKETDKILSVCM